MPRVIGIDPGTVSIDLCGLDDGRLFLDRSLPTAEALRAPDAFRAVLESAGSIDLVAGPSGYGLPLIPASEASDADIRLAYLAAAGEPGGIGGLRSLVRTLAESSIPVVLTPGVIHLPSVPVHRKLNRIDMGTADKLCAAILAVRERARQLDTTPGDVSFILLELGGAFSAAVAVRNGLIVDGAGGSAGPMGLRAAGALDGEVAYLAGAVTKGMLFTGGAASVAGIPDLDADGLTMPVTAAGRVAWDAYLESAAKAVAALAVSVPGVRHVVLSGRLARAAIVRDELERRLGSVFGGMTVDVLTGFAQVAKQAAQGAALLADGLMGGTSAALVETMGIREATGTVLDHLYVISPGAARTRLGIGE
jgi:predicted butyrate kinase (DUF1464 family)